jgi:hypothetical protein
VQPTSGTTNINSLNNVTANELDSSLLLAVGNGVSVNGTTYTVAPNCIGLASNDGWFGTLTNPDSSDTVSITTTMRTSNPSPGVVEYTSTDAGGAVSPATGGIGAEVVAWNSPGVLLEQLSGYVPGPSAVINPDGEFHFVAPMSLVMSQDQTSLGLSTSSSGC